MIVYDELWIGIWEQSKFEHFIILPVPSKNNIPYTSLENTTTQKTSQILTNYDIITTTFLFTTELLQELRTKISPIKSKIHKVKTAKQLILKNSFFCMILQCVSHLNTLYYSSVKLANINTISPNNSSIPNRKQ